MKKILFLLIGFTVSIDAFAQNVYPMSLMYYNMDTSHVVSVGRFDFLDTLNLHNRRMPNYVSAQVRDSLMASVSMDNMGVKFCKTKQLTMLSLVDQELGRTISQCIKEYIRRTKLYDPSKMRSRDSVYSADYLGIQMVDSSGIFVYVRIMCDTLGKPFVRIEPKQNVFMNNVLIRSPYFRNWYGCFYIDSILCVVELYNMPSDWNASSLFIKDTKTLVINVYRREVEFCTSFGFYDCSYDLE